MDHGGLEPLSRPGLHHWRQATVVDSTLDNRSNVFFAAVEMTRMPMILADPRQEDCPIAFANNAFLDLTGYEESEVVGRNCRFLQGAGTDPGAVRQLREAIASRQPIALEILNYRRDGSPFWNAIFMGPVLDSDGNLIYFFASQLDVSKRRDSELALRQAQKMEAIGQLTAGLAHDFNNLLQILNGSLERMKAMRHDDRRFERHHAAALQAADRGAKLTNQLLAFARRTRLEPKACDLSALINSFGDLLEASVGNKVALHLNLRRRLPPVRVDPSHFEMALLNVLVNARDASPTGSAVRITTQLIHLNGDAAAHHLPSGDYVMVSVSDEGGGMPAHIAARAVEPFFTTKPHGQGTGLGLAMVSGFVQQSGGRLEIDSAPQSGTTIRMIFPLMDVERENRPEPEDAGYRTQPVEQNAAAPLILIVEDSREIADLAQETLLDVGYRVVVAYDAEDGMKRFEEQLAAGDPFRLVFSDVLMPGGENGMMLAERIMARHGQTVILLTTGYNDEMSLDGPDAGRFEVLGKPYQRSELIDRVQAALRRGARTGPDRQTSDFGHAQA